MNDDRKEKIVKAENMLAKLRDLAKEYNELSHELNLDSLVLVHEGSTFNINNLQQSINSNDYGWYNSGCGEEEGAWASSYGCEY